jgi:hypothetical protein
MIVAATSGNKARIQVAGMVNPVTRDAWKSVGIESDADTNLLEGLITQDKIYVVPAPKLTCSDGKITTYYCNWTKAEYTQTAVTTPTTTTVPTTTTTTTASTADTIAPSTPGKPTISMTYDWSKLKYAYVINWPLSKDNVAVLRYVIKRNGQTLATPSKPAYQDFTFVSGRTYEYSVQAQDQAGNVSPSSPSVKVKDSCTLIFCNPVFL